MAASMSEQNKNEIELVRNFDLNSIDKEFITNPFPTCRALRNHSPLHQNADGSLFLTRYDDVMTAYRHPAMSSDKKVAFKEKFGESPLYTHHTTSLIFNDPPYHTVVRKLLSSGFTPRKLRSMEPLIEKIVDGLLDRLSDLRTFDLVSEYAMALPTEIISFMLGIPEEHRHLLRQYSLNILGALDPVVSQKALDAGNTSVSDFGEMLKDIVDHRRKKTVASSDGEILMSLILGEVDGRKLTTQELIQNCIFLLNAGHETTTRLIGNGMYTLFNHQDQMMHLKNNYDLIPNAIEEMLRYEPPVHATVRFAESDMIYNEKSYKRGTAFAVSIAGANRDPEANANPNEFDILRDNIKHISFGYGPHMCIGASLARIESRIAFESIFERFSKLELLDQNPSWGKNLIFRGFDHLNLKAS